MNLNEYSTKAMAFASLQATKKDDLIHGALGVTSDMGELIECLAGPRLRRESTNTNNLVEEAGDVIWFCNLIAVSSGGSLEAIHAEALEKYKGLRSMPVDMLETWLVISSCRIADVIKAHAIYGKRLDGDALDREIGHTLVKIAQLVGLWGFSLEDILNANIAKLTTRYGAKYDQQKALNRDKEAERAAIDGATA